MYVVTHCHTRIESTFSASIVLFTVHLSLSFIRHRAKMFRTKQPTRCIKYPKFRIVWPCIAKIAYEWDQQRHCKFPICMDGTIALHVSGSFSAHHQERYQPYNGFGTILCSSVTDCCQEHDGTEFHPVPESSRSPSCIKLYQNRCTADNAPDDGQKTCPKHVELLCH